MVASRAADLQATATRLDRSITRVVRLTPAVRDAATRLSAEYRNGSAGEAPRLDVPSLASAYAAVRMSATFAAASQALAAGADRLPRFEPRSLLDVGAGTGATTWAARVVFPSIDAVTLVDREPAAAALGRELAASRDDRWLIADVATATLPDADLVTAGYVIGELGPGEVRHVTGRLWAAARGVLVLVEPGTPAGFGRIQEARTTLLAAGAAIVAPCPGNVPCPLADAGTAWCHFLARHDRSVLQRRAKAATRSWEDEPFSYLVAARPELIADPRPRVVLGRPRHRPGVVELRVCDGGRIETVVVSRRSGPAYRVARTLRWGDALSATLRGEG